MDPINTLLAHVRRLPHSEAARTIDVRVGPFWAVVSTSAGAGMASTMAACARPHVGAPVAEAGALLERSPLELTEMLASSSATEAAVGLAAVNALLGHPGGRVTTDKALDVLLERGRDKLVAIIGCFPFVETLREGCGRLWVFERGDDLPPGCLGADRMPELLPRADIVAITATTLINGTLPEVMAHVSDHSWTMMLGPSTPMSDSLLERGFDILCGTVVENAQAVLTAASQGAVTKQFTGVKRLSLWR